MHSPPKPPSFFKKLIHCICIGLLLMLFCWAWLQVPFTLDSETLPVKTSLFFNKLLLNKDSNFTGEFVFIDISGNKQLVARPDNSGDDVITHRAKLDTFFKLVNKYPGYRYILCDVLFEKALSGDSSFAEILAATPRLIIPANETEEGVQPALFTEAEQGLASYSLSSGLHASNELVKYPLLYTPNARSIPLMMHERLTGRQSASFMGLLIQKGRVGFNRFIPTIRMEQRQLANDTATNIYALNYLLLLMKSADSAYCSNFFRNKYIVIGDFVTDSHPTTQGPMCAPLLLANIYLAVREGDNIITIPWLLYVWVAFIVLAGWVFYPLKFIKKWEEKLLGSSSNILFALEELAMAAFVLWLISLGSYLFFNKHLDVVAPSIFISFFAIITKIRNHTNKKLNTITTHLAA